MRASRRGVGGVVAVAAVVGAVLLVRPGGGEPGADRGAPTPPASSPTSTDPVIDAETFCNTYSKMADAYGFAIATPGDETYIAQVEETGEAFLEVGRPPGMGPPEAAGRERFVADLYSSVGVSQDDDAGPAASEELAAFSRFLTKTCPGF